MKKFAFLIHTRDSYRVDQTPVAKPFAGFPESVHKAALRNRPLPPFIWSDVTLTPNATEPEGHIIILPYSGLQLLQQQKAMIHRIEQGLKLAASVGADIVGLGALMSPITMGGSLLMKNRYTSVTNGNAFSAVTAWRKVAQLIQQCPKRYPVVALVGATGNIGTLVCELLAAHQPEIDYLLIEHNNNRLQALASAMSAINASVVPMLSQQIDDISQADIVVLLSSVTDALLQARYLKTGAVILDDTIPRITQCSLLKERPDITIIDGGLVSIPHLSLSRSIGLPGRISYTCMAETMLLAQAGHEGHFSIGNSTLEQAEYISKLACQFAHLGFGPAPDYSFGKRINGPSTIRHKVPAMDSVSTF